MADFVTVAEDFVIIKITQFSDFVKKGSKLQGTAHTSILNARPILLYIINEDEPLNFQEKIPVGRIAGKNRKDQIIDPKVDQFYDLFLLFQSF